MKKQRSIFTIARLLASGALLGVVVAGMLGVDVSYSGAVGVASGAGVLGSVALLKLVHIL